MMASKHLKLIASATENDEPITANMEQVLMLVFINVCITFWIC